MIPEPPLRLLRGGFCIELIMVAIPPTVPGIDGIKGILGKAVIQKEHMCGLHGSSYSKKNIEPNVFCF
jgi:hypothetical protein